MDEQQAFSAIKNILRLENIARRVLVPVAPGLRDFHKNLADQIASGPEDAIARELRWKNIRDGATSTMEAVVDDFQEELYSALDEEAPRQVDWARKYVDSGAAVAPAMASRAVKSAKFLGMTLDKIFGEGYVTKSELRIVDSVVKTGFVRGDSNAKIARELRKATHRSLAQTRAISRTAVHSMAAEAHEAFWDANSEGIVEYRWDATFDYRVCEICAPLDGVRHKKRSQFPRGVPAHPNCRCLILPVTRTEKLLESEGEGLDRGDRAGVQLYKNKPQEGPNLRVYKEPVTINGKKYWRAAKDLPEMSDGQAVTMGDFLWRANELTRINVLGKDRAQRFTNLIVGTPGTRSRLTPAEALVRVTK